MLDNKGRKFEATDHEATASNRNAATTEQRALSKSGKSISLLLPHGALICETGLVLPDDLDFEQFAEIGPVLCTAVDGLQWAIGDYWVRAEAYGKRKARAVALNLPYEFSTLMVYGSIARNVPALRRIKALRFSHHALVAALSPEDQTKWLKKAVKAEWSVSAMRAAMKAASDVDCVEVTDKPGSSGEATLDTQARDFVSALKSRAENAVKGEIDTGIHYELLEKVVDGQITELIEVCLNAATYWQSKTDALLKYQANRSKIKRVRA